jgi:hypothetical protein
MNLKGLDEITSQGRELLTQKYPEDANEGFDKWVAKTADWLNEIVPDSGLYAEWCSLNVSTLWTGASSYYDDFKSWQEYKNAVLERLDWLSSLPKVMRTSNRVETIFPMPDLSRLVSEPKLNASY